METQKEGKVKIFVRTIPSFFLAGLLASCNSFTATPTRSPADVMETALATVSTALAETQRAMPTATPSPLPFAALPLPTLSFPSTTPFPSPTPLPTIPTFTPLVFTDPSIPLSERIVYYYFVTPVETSIPQGTVHAIHLLAPTYTDETYTSDTAADLRTALAIALHDGRNFWRGNKLDIVEVTFHNGHASVVLQGEYFGMGDAQLCAGSLQILLTLFANPSVQSAAVTLNGGPIGTLCLFREGDPPVLQTVDHVYARAVIETYMKENAYGSP
jgi:hypothetical protein